MATDDRQIIVTGTAPAPATWLVPGNGQITPRTVFAHYNGTSAAGSFFPALKVISDAGQTVGIYPCATAIAAGGSADVSWFPGVDDDTSAGNPFASETLFLPAWATSVTSAQTLATGTVYNFSIQGTFSVWNAALNNGTPDADAIFPSIASGQTRVSTQVGLDPDTEFAGFSPPPTTIGHSSALEMNLGSGWSHVEPIGGPYTTRQANNVYTYQVTGQGQPISFRINDSPLTDNYGALKITFFGTTPGGQGLVVTDGTHSVQSTIELDFTSGATVTDAGNGNAHVAISGGSGTISDITSTGGTLSVTAPTGPTTNLDMPATGVGAGTYGDSTHVAEVTVDAEGRITAASSVAISGSAGAGGLLTLYDSGYLGADAASIDTGAGGVAAGHGNLMIFLYLRTTDAGVNNENVIMRFNNDSGANYVYQRIQAAGGGAPTTTANNAATFALVGAFAAATTAANIFGAGTIEIPDYDDTANMKAGNLTQSLMDTAAGNQINSVIGFLWNSTAAISRVAVLSNGGGNIKAGSRMMVCGTQ